MAAPTWFSTVDDAVSLVEPVVLCDQGRPQCRREEHANALSHGLGFVIAAAAWPMLSDYAAQQAGSLAALGMAVFCLSAMFVYAASMIYHALPAGPAKVWARRVDHAAIFVFIAGSYTPFALGPLAESMGTVVLASVWSVAGVGVGCKVLGHMRHRIASTLLYAVMGWMALALLVPLRATAGDEVIALLLAGGAAYTVGTVFFHYDDRLRYGHFVWHLFVLVGSGLHMTAALAALSR